jgi:hypothetical protein
MKIWIVFAVCWEVVIVDPDVSFGVTITLMKKLSIDPQRYHLFTFCNTGAIVTSHSSLLRLSVEDLHYSIPWSATPCLFSDRSILYCMLHIYLWPFLPPTPCLLQVPYSAPYTSYYIRTVVQCTLYINIVKVYLSDLAFSYCHFFIV